MAIDYAILGFLSWRKLSGYDIKKLFEQSYFMHWSGNNNQIYNTLIRLRKDGFVTSEIENRESGPSKKNYSITASGREELKRWILSDPELPQEKNTFVLRIAWAEILTADELESMFERYEQEVEMQLLMRRELKRRREVDPARSARERYLWRKIAERRIASDEAELAWVREIRTTLTAGAPYERNEEE